MAVYLGSNKVAGNYNSNIVESGSNSNGNYIKFSDGTMICYGTAIITSPTYSDWYGFCRLTNTFTINLPIAFKDNNYSLELTSKTFGYFSSINNGKNVDNFTFRACTHNQSAYNPGNGNFNYIAIGKWK